MIFLGETPGIVNIQEALFPNLPNFLAHIIATVVMVLVLWKLVYNPYKQFNKNQADEINKLLIEASEKNALANKTKAEAEIILEDARNQSQDIILEATVAADTHRTTEINKVKQEINTLHENADKSIKMEREKLKEDIQKEIIQVAFEASKKIIGDKITKADNERLVKQFLDNIK